MGSGGLWFTSVTGSRPLQVRGNELKQRAGGNETGADWQPSVITSLKRPYGWGTACKRVSTGLIEEKRS